jgi:hypothetical protein
MFHWIKNLFSKKETHLPKAPERLDTFLPQERNIFSYFDGEKLIKADPLPLWTLAVSEHHEATQGHDELVSKIRKHFNVKSFEEGGLLDVECVDLLLQFKAYCDSIKKKQVTTPTSSETISPSSSSISEESLHTKNGSDSGSAAKEPSIAKQEQSPMEQPLPLDHAIPNPITMTP